MHLGGARRWTVVAVAVFAAFALIAAAALAATGARTCQGLHREPRPPRRQGHRGESRRQLGLRRLPDWRLGHQLRPRSVVGADGPAPRPRASNEGHADREYRGERRSRRSCPDRDGRSRAGGARDRC